MSVRFDPLLCDRNPYCPVADACPTGALFVDRKTFRPSLDPSKCTDCGSCVETCPRGAISRR